MVVETKLITSEAFFDFIALPENRDKHFERISGRIIEKMVSGGSASIIAILISRYLVEAIYDLGLGIVSGADGGYIVSGEQYIPDVAVVLHKSQPQRTYERGYNTIAPDLAVEVLSPTDRQKDLATKIINYTLAGTVVWAIDPEDQTVTVYVPEKLPQTLTVNDTLTGGDVIPEFSVPIKNIFPRE